MYYAIIANIAGHFTAALAGTSRAIRTTSGRVRSRYNVVEVPHLPVTCLQNIMCECPDCEPTLIGEWQQEGTQQWLSWKWGGHLKWK